jgi:hypothetical protein
MRGQFRSLVVFAIASTLVACAATEPAVKNDSATASVGTSAPAAAAAAAATPRDKGKKAGSGYRQLTRNGQEVFCRREPVTGSRTETVETCLTKAQLDASIADSQDALRRIQAVPGSIPGMDSSGGQQMGAMSR